MHNITEKERVSPKPELVNPEPVNDYQLSMKSEMEVFHDGTSKGPI